MQGIRSAFVVTGFVVLGLGSSLAWKYPRPQLLGSESGNVQMVIAKSQSLEQVGIRCRPNEDWTDLLVESSDSEKAREHLKQAQNVGFSATTPLNWQSPPALLADLARLPGVKEAQVVIHEGHEAVVMLSMVHGAYAGDRALLQQVEELVRATCPQVDIQNIKILDNRGSDLTYLAPNFPGARPNELQVELQAQVDAAVGAHQGLVFVHQGRGPDSKVHIQVGLYLITTDQAQILVVQQTLEKFLTERLTKVNEVLKQQWKSPLILSLIHI